MNGDMGQSYVIGGMTAGSTSFQIRVRDAAGQLINNGRVYSFPLPAACGSTCGQAYTETTYTTDTTGTTPTTPPTSTPPASPGACAASSSVVSTWAGGFQSTVTVTAGDSAINGWTTQWAFAHGEQVTQMWNASYTASGSSVTAHNATWNGTLAAHASTTFGYTASGTPGTVTIACT